MLGAPSSVLAPRVSQKFWEFMPITLHTSGDHGAAVNFYSAACVGATLFSRAARSKRAK